MPFPSWLAILVGFCLGLSGCMKAADQVALVAPAPPNEAVAPAVPGVEPGPAAPLPPPERLHGAGAPDWAIPELLLAESARWEGAGDEERALQALDRAAEAFAGQGDAAGRARVFCRRVLLLAQTGRDRAALELLREGRTTGGQTAAFLDYLDGRLALMQSDFERARELLHRSLRGCEALPPDVHALWLRREAELASGMAAVLAVCEPRWLAAYGQEAESGADGDLPGEGAAFLRDALALNRELRETPSGPFMPADDFSRVEAGAMAFLGLDAGARGNTGEALRLLSAAADLSRAAGFREGEIRSCLFLGELGLMGGDGAAGRQAAEALRERADLYRAAAYRVWARFLLARYDRAGGRTAEAIAALREADGILSDQRSAETPAMLARIGRRQRRALYEWLVEMLAGERRGDEALVAAEKARARRMVDLLAGQEIGGSPAGRDLLGREAELSETIRVLRQRLLHESGALPGADLLGRLAAAEADYRDLLGRLGEEDGRLLALVSPPGFDPAALQRLLGQEATLFEYFCTPGRLYVWAVHGERIQLGVLDLDRGALRNLVGGFLDAIRGKDRKKTESLARQAYDRLLKPVIPFVSGERIVFVPDDCLVYLPFAALNYRGRVLAEGFSISILPRAGLYEPPATGTDAAEPRILALAPGPAGGLPELPGALDELERIGRRTGRMTLLRDGQATATAAAELAPEADILHFAARSVFDPEAPWRSGLLLAPAGGRSGAWRIPEILRFRCPGRAVILAGCDPRPEADPGGEGLLALQQAFLQAGSPAVVSTLWRTDEPEAGRFWESFYRQREKEASVADALRAVQLRLLRAGAPALLWAAVVVTGR